MHQWENPESGHIVLTPETRLELIVTHPGSEHQRTYTVVFSGQILAFAHHTGSHWTIRQTNFEPFRFATSWYPNPVMLCKDLLVATRSRQVESAKEYAEKLCTSEDWQERAKLLGMIQQRQVNCEQLSREIAALVALQHPPVIPTTSGGDPIEYHPEDAADDTPF